MMMNIGKTTLRGSSSLKSKRSGDLLRTHAHSWPRREQYRFLAGIKHVIILLSVLEMVILRTSHADTKKETTDKQEWIRAVNGWSTSISHLKVAC